MFVMKLGYYFIILRKLWFNYYNSRIKFSTNKVTFDSDYYLEHCCPNSAYAREISIPLPEKITFVSSTAFTHANGRK